MPDGDRVSRLLMTTDTVGGVWSYALQLATLLAGRGVEIVMAAMGGEPTKDQRAQAAAVPRLKLHASTFAVEWMPNPWDDVARAGDWLLTLERDVKPDVVHLNGFAHGRLPFRAPPVVVAHSCVASWWTAVKREPLPDQWSLYVSTVRSGLASASRIVAPSRAMRDALVRCYGVGHDAVVIPNVRAVERWRRQPKEPFILAAGNTLDPAKNIAALDRAAAGLPWPVKVAGGVATRQVASRSLRHATALGRQTPDDMMDLMGRASIFAHPALYEPFGLSVLEAALSGCALVLGDIDALRENWSGTARFVAPDDDVGLRDTLRELIAKPAEREALAAAALRRAELFSPHQHRDRYYDLYVEMIDQGRSSGAIRPAAAPSSIAPRS
jgi:glycosyltransferase involved in cell wall biosynthesis